MATIFEQLDEIFNEYDNKLNELTKRVEQLEKASEPSFEVGDKVRITTLRTVNNVNPLFPIGTIGTIKNIITDDFNCKMYEIWDDKCITHGWWYDEGEFELVEEESKQSEEPKFPKFKIGDKVRTLKERNNGEYAILFPIGTVGVIEFINTDTQQYRVVKDNSYDWWYYDEENIELVKE